MKQLVADLNREGVTILISSHILYELDEMSTRMVLVHRGQTLAEGAPHEILEIIDQFPHRILINAPLNQLKELSKHLIESTVVKSLEFATETKPSSLIAITDKPSSFYPEVTRIVADNGLLINHLESQTDNIEAIFEYLT